MLNIVLFGPPGAGKGTQAAMLIEKYGFKHISTGEAIRAEIAAGTELGKSMEDYIAAGHLAPDELVISIVEDYLENHANGSGNIFDGFPRTIHQAEVFDRMLAGKGKKIDVMLSLEVPDDQLVRRLLLRGKESGRADDSNEEIIRNRLRVYKNSTEVVASYYRPQGKYRSVPGEGNIEEVFAQLCRVIDSML